MSKTTQRKSVLVFGAAGRMGQELSALLAMSKNFRLAASVDNGEIMAFDDGHTAILKQNPKALVAVLQGVDIVIDFSSPTGTSALTVGLQKAKGLTVLVGTTGLSVAQKKKLISAAKDGGHKILITGNTSLGIATLAKISKLAATELAPNGFDIEILESHHRMKVDAPSGTAKLLAAVLARSIKGSKVVLNRKGRRSPNTIGIHCVRGGGVIGEHEIRFISDNEELSFLHRAFSRSLFATGAVNLVQSIEGKLTRGSCVELIDFLST